MQFRNYKVIYRRYAGLYFSFVCDVTDNELSILELIHLFVELLDAYFGNVCLLAFFFSLSLSFPPSISVFLCSPPPAR